MTKALCALVLGGLICLVVGAAPAQPISFNWIEQTNKAYDSGDVLLGAGASALVVWDADGSGLGGWSPTDPLPAGDVVLQDFSSLDMEFLFSDFFPGEIVGNWTVNDGEPWQQNGEELYLLAYVPDTLSSSGLDEWGVGPLTPVAGWPNGVIEHNIEGGGPIHTAPIPEPATFGLVAGGLAILALKKRRK